jgi:hypothetical protein
MRRMLGICALVSGLLVATASTAFAQALVRVSTTDPDAGCTVGAVPGSVNFSDAEVEPFLADNPAHPANLLGAWQQDRWSDGGAHGLVAGWSFNGGTTWGETQLPFTECAGPGAAPYQRASDPGVTFSRDGAAYAIAISFDGDSVRNAVAAATSADGGRTWGSPHLLIQDAANPATGNPFNDKELIFGDPTRAGVASAVWDRLEDVPGAARTHAPMMTTRPGPSAVRRAQAQQQPPAFTGPTFLSRTTDGGRTWEPAHVIVPTGVNEQTIGNYIVIDPRTGVLYDFFTFYTADGVPHAAFVSSSDGGTTWSQLRVFADEQTVGVKGYRTGNGIPIPAVDPRNGTLYVTWQDSRFNGGTFDEVLLTSSRDGGSTWSKPVRVNQPTTTGQPAFTSTVAVNSLGQVAVTYYQTVAFQANDKVDYFSRISSSGGRSFGAPDHLAGPFDVSTAPNAGGLFLGDYEGLATVGRTFHPFFVTTTGQPDPTDVFTTAVG